jgi:hypothetical protein
MHLFGRENRLKQGFKDSILENRLRFSFVSEASSLCPSLPLCLPSNANHPGIAILRTASASRLRPRRQSEDASLTAWIAPEIGFKFGEMFAT